MPFTDAPTVTVEIGFSSDPSETTLVLDDTARGLLDTGTLGQSDGSWTDVSDYLRGFSTDRGKNAGDDQFRDGTATVVLDNTDGRFDPSNLSGPYVAGGVTQIEPMKRLRIRATWNSVTYDVFHGFIDEWFLHYVNPNDAYVVVPATDAFKVLANYDGREQSAQGSGETTGARMTRILDNAVFPGGDRDLDTGDSTVQATTLAQNALGEMKLTASSEMGHLFVDAAGLVVFRDRHSWLEDARSQTAQVTLGDDAASIAAGTQLGYRELRRDNGADWVRNDISFARTGGEAQTATDATSAAKYLTRTWNRTDLLNETDAEVDYLADWALLLYKDRRDAFSEATIAPRRQPSAWWPKILDAQFGDLWEVNRTPPGLSAITRQAFVVGVSHSCDVNRDWTVRVRLEDATAWQGFLILDDATLGKLDTGKLAAV